MQTHKRRLERHDSTVSVDSNGYPTMLGKDLDVLLGTTDLEKAADALADADVPAERGGLKQVMKKPAADKTEEATYMHPTLGKLKLTRASKQSYITITCKGQDKWTLLVAVSASQTPHHHEMAAALLHACTNMGMDKPNVIALRNRWLEEGSEPPFMA